ncbi:MAG: arginine--tRNA ligase, partial [Acetatifactor sp.]|nr:arginine--tRNA ligase [Acetatifactor sp.]
YVPYTYARAISILRKGAQDAISGDIDYSILTEDSSYKLVKALSEYHSAVTEAAERYEPCVIARFLIKVSSRFNKFYHDCSILQADPKVKEARLALVDLTQNVLRDACGLLGMECPEEM